MSKPEVSITLHACPRCGWPDADKPAALPAAGPRIAPAPAASPPPRPRGRPRKPRTGPLTRLDFGLTQAEWDLVASDTIATDWYVRYVCEREGHTHGEAGLLHCMFRSIGKLTIEQETNPPGEERALTWYRREVCGKGRHTHGEEGELDCMLMRMALFDRGVKGA